MLFRIYKAVSPSGKVYVGLTGGTLRRRMGQHYGDARRGGSYPFHNALRKYGDRLVWSVLEEVEGYEEACDAEIRWIDGLGAAVSGYNATFGGDGGVTPTEETRRRISEGLRGRILSREHRERIAEGLKGRRSSEQSKEKNRKAHLGKRASKETRQKMHETHLGQVLSEDTKEKLRGREFSVEHRQKLSEAGKGREFRTEHRARMSQAHSQEIVREDGVVFPSGIALAQELGVSPNAVYQGIKHKWRIKGVRYRYKTA